MDINAILGPDEKDDDIKKHCHVNTNEDGDRFVGIKADSDEIMVYFPIGYNLPDDDGQIRLDIKNLISVLSEFTTKDDRLLAMQKFEAPQTVDFPINAYRNVIEYYFSIGGNYYVETDPTYKTSATGNQDWKKTVKQQTPLVQRIEIPVDYEDEDIVDEDEEITDAPSTKSIYSLIFTNFTVRTSTPNSNKLITQINRYCVYEAFKHLGWLYVPYMPEPPGEHPDIKTSKAIVASKLATTFDDKKKTLFQSMKRMLDFIDEQTSERQFYFGTDDFDHVWERLIDTAFGVDNKEKYFPRTRWLLDYGAVKEKRPLMPDTVMIYNGKYYILDAKCYRYGWTGVPDHLPNGADINKQITYGEYLEKSMGVQNDSLFNAFIMPYNMARNHFKLTSTVGNIGEAVGDWKHNKKNYERIQGIVMDTRYLMYHYMGKPMKDKVALAECIEAVLSKAPVPPPSV